MVKRLITQSDPPITDANELLVGMNERAAKWRRAAIIWLWLYIVTDTILNASHRPLEWYWMLLCGLVPSLAATIVSHWCRRIHRQRVLEADCIYCGYNLAGNESSVCPECGNHVIVLPPGSLRRHPPVG
jgi:hypothetical protein